MRGPGPMLLLALAGCSVNVHLYDHGFVDGAADTSSSAQQQPRPTNPGSAAHAVFYIRTTPVSLARVVLISDGRDNTISRDMGETPITYRMKPGTRLPIGPESCGRMILLKVDKDGFASEIARHRVSCARSEEAAESSQNEITVALRATPTENRPQP